MTIRPYDLHDLHDLHDLQDRTTCKPIYLALPRYL